MSRKLSDSAPFMEVGRLYESGMSRPDIAKHFNVDKYTIYNRLKTYEGHKKAQAQVKKPKKAGDYLLPNVKPVHAVEADKDMFANPLLVVDFQKGVTVDRLSEFLRMEAS